MKNILIGLALLAATALLAQMPPPNGPRPTPEQLIQMFDRNGDGKISRDEAPLRMLQHWDDIDTDHDGFITLEELKARDARVAGMGNGSGQPALRESSAKPESIPAVILGTRACVNAANTSGLHDGKTWATAFASLQEALNSRAAEIWVAKGTYSPGNDRNATFQLHPDGAVYGGFTGNETRRDRRDWRKNKTVLEGQGAYHVVTGADDAVLDGFTVTGGNALGGPREGPPRGTGGGPMVHTTPDAVLSSAGNGCGAGMLNVQASPTVRNCIFENNQAGKGGAVYNMTSTSFPPRPDAHGKAPVFINCSFRHNSAQGRGGGVSNDLGTAPTFLNCVFADNETPQKGGGMYDDFGSSPALINCLFTGNRAESAGGLGNDGGSSPVLFDCTFTNNHAVDYGAPLYQGTGPASDPALISCVITNNTCDWDGPGIYNWHDDTPFIKEAMNGDAGYRPDRFTEAQLPDLLNELKLYRAQPVREAFAAAPEETIPHSQRIIYVNAAHAGSGDGTSWNSAYSSLQTALADAGKDGAEIQAAVGKYELGANRADAFLLQPGVRLFGGYTGQGGQRDPAKNLTILEGNHAFHVLVGANGAVLDGVTITGGCADGTGDNGQGGGLINYRRGPQGRPNSEVVTGFAMTIHDCVFTNNYARDGGVVYSYDRAKPVFIDCVFAGNRAENGGAVLDRVGVDSVFTNCEFTGNSAQWRGGAVYFDYGSRPQLTGCVFRNNSTGGLGGAVFSVTRASQLENTIVTLTGCRFENNSARGYGGAANFHDSSVAFVRNGAFAGNHAGLKGNAVAVTGNSTWQSEGNSIGAGDVYQQPTTRRGEGEGQPSGRPMMDNGGQSSSSGFEMRDTGGLLTNDRQAFAGDTLVSPLGSTSTYMIDAQGRVVHAWHSAYRPGMSARLLPNGDLLRCGSLGREVSESFRGVGGAGGIIEERTWDDQLVWQYRFADDREIQNHDVAAMPNGDVLLLAWQRESAAQAIDAGRNPELLPDDGLFSESIVEIKPTGLHTGRMVWRWNLWDHLMQDYNPAKANYGNISDHPGRLNINYVPDRGPSSRGGADWTHFNSIAYNAQLDQILISSRNTSEIYIIDHSTTTQQAGGHAGGRGGQGGDFLFRWGNPQVYGHGTAVDHKLFVQHDASWIPAGLLGAGNILVFNNGSGRPDGSYSTVDEIQPPLLASGGYARAQGAAYGPDEPVWRYQAADPESFYSDHLGSAQRLPDGNTLICAGVSGVIFQVTRSGKMVWKYQDALGGGGMREGNQGGHPGGSGLEPVQGGPQGGRLGGGGSSLFDAFCYGPDYPGVVGRTLAPVTLGDILEGRNR